MTLKSRSTNNVSIAIFLMAYFGLSIAVLAQQPAPPEATTEDTVNLSSPYHAIKTHLWFLQPDYRYDAVKSAEAFPEGIPDRVTKAIQLKQIFDGKGLYIALSQLPRNPDYVDTLANENIFVLSSKELPSVYLEKIGDNWYYSQETIERIPKLHRQVYPFGTDWLIGIIPQADHYQFLGLKLWQYIGILILFALTWFTHQFTSWGFRLLIKQIVKTRLKRIIIDKDLIYKIAQLASYILMIWVVMRLFPILQLSIDLSSSVIIGLKVLRTILLVFLGFRFVDMLLLILDRVTEKTENTLDEQILPIVKQTLRILFATVGIIYSLNLLSVNVTALIAGISIGGLALALAAQDTVKNLIGSVMIFIDRPFQIGDFVKLGSDYGTIEEVGFRSTRIRTPENSLLTIPNGNLANMVVDNLGLRVYRRFYTNFGLTYGTPPEKINAFVEGIAKIIKEHPKTRKDYFEVHFNNMSASSLDVLMVAYFEVPSWTEELRARHELLIAVLELAKNIGVDFAFPSTSVYMEKQ